MAVPATTALSRIEFLSEIGRECRGCLSTRDILQGLFCLRPNDIESIHDGRIVCSPIALLCQPPKAQYEVATR